VQSKKRNTSARLGYMWFFFGSRIEVEKRRLKVIETLKTLNRTITRIDRDLKTVQSKKRDTSTRLGYMWFFFGSRIEVEKRRLKVIETLKILNRTITRIDKDLKTVHSKSSG
jgi:hypothetical protein